MARYKHAFTIRTFVSKGRRSWIIPSSHYRSKSTLSLFKISYFWSNRKFCFVKGLFTTYEVTTMDEATLSAGAFLVNTTVRSSGANAFSVTLQPMEIRTFLVNVKNKLRRKSNLVRDRLSVWWHQIDWNLIHQLFFEFWC